MRSIQGRVVFFFFRYIFVSKRKYFVIIKTKIHNNIFIQQPAKTNLSIEYIFLCKLNYHERYDMVYISGLRVRVMAFNATFNNISVISWRLIFWRRKPECRKKPTDLPQVRGRTAKREVGEKGAGGGRRRVGRWETEGWEVGEVKLEKTEPPPHVNK